MSKPEGWQRAWGIAPSAAMDDNQASGFDPEQHPANPIQLALIARGKALQAGENPHTVVAQVLGETTQRLVADKNSILYGNSISKAVAKSPITKLPVGKVKPAKAIADKTPITTDVDRSRVNEVIDIVTCQRWLTLGFGDRRRKLEEFQWGEHLQQSQLDEISRQVTVACGGDTNRSDNLFDQICAGDWQSRSELLSLTNRAVEERRRATQSNLEDAIGHALPHQPNNTTPSASKQYYKNNNIRPSGILGNSNNNSEIESEAMISYIDCDGPTPSGWNEIAHPGFGYVRLPWLQIGDVMPRGGFDALDPVQGGVGDCWIIANLSSIAWAKPGLLESFVRYIPSVPRLHGSSLYAVRINGEEQIISDRFPCSPNHFVRMFAGSARDGAMWPALFEKAFYCWVSGNHTDRPILDGLPYKSYIRERYLTFVPIALAGGGRRVEWRTTDPRAGQNLGIYARFNSTSPLPTVDFDRIRSYCDSNGRIRIPMTAGCGYGNEYIEYRSGLVNYHAFSVFGTAVFGDRKAIILRNPWGDGTPIDAEWGNRMIVPAPGRWNGLDVSGRYHGVFAMDAEWFPHYFWGVDGVDI